VSDFFGALCLFIVFAFVLALGLARGRFVFLFTERVLVRKSAPIWFWAVAALLAALAGYTLYRLLIGLT